MHAAPTWDPQQYLRHAGPPHPPLPRPPRPDPRTARRRRAPHRRPRLRPRQRHRAARRPLARRPHHRLRQLPARCSRGRGHAGPTPGGGSLDFRRADAADWTPDEPYDLIVSNAALQWVPGHADRFPDWLDAPRPRRHLRLPGPRQLHRAQPRPARRTVRQPRSGAPGSPATAPPRATSSSPPTTSDRLTDLGCAADVWETTYLQLLQGEDPVLDWVKGTALRPVLTALADDPRGRDASSPSTATCCARPTRPARTARSSRSAGSSPSPAPPPAPPPAAAPGTAR